MIRREEGRKTLRIHIVQKGDTLWKIAKEYGVSFEDLKRLNAHLANPDYIVPGMEIILPEKINKDPHREGHRDGNREGHRETNWGTHREGNKEGHRETNWESHKEGQKETKMHKESPTKPVKESIKKEVQRPMPPPVVVPPPPMPEPQMIPIPYPMPMPMPQQPMFVPQPVELSWNQQVVMPQVEQTQNVAPPPVQIQPPPIVQPAPQPPLPQPIFIMPPPMPAVPHCSSCHQPVHHHMWWPMHMPMHMPMQMPMQMPMEPQVEAYTMPQQPTSCEMKGDHVAGMENFLESSTSPFFQKPETFTQPQFQPMPEMNMGQSCGCNTQPMMPNWQMDPCHCPPPCPPPPCPSACPPPCPSCEPWVSPHLFPGGMTPYRW